ncbi:hypothetical protein [Leptolyngbya sp. GGD]|uniref:hypothetical protein n=1 Tax=Leptolyngbya sp. GGD TaxID=2997907 RepID=UPI00227B10C7|nr:hypothetical protein [Leptolyngbya sp. GGD]MCY6493860.1 hypothetical protein [Leptolyngbya sp. GGD]
MFRSLLMLKVILISYLIVLIAPKITIGEANKTLKLSSDSAIAQSVGIFDLFGWRRPRISLGTRGICILTPGSIRKFSVWNTRPLFLWKGRISQITVRDRETKKILWVQAIRPTDQQIYYTAPTPLQSGKQYEWTFANPVSSTSRWLAFDVIPIEQHTQIATDLQTLEKQWKSKGESTEAIALQKASYFVDRNLWSDALQALYEIENPSQSFSQQRQAYVKDICSSRSSNTP